MRIGIAQKIIRAYPFPRGKDRTYLILRSFLKLPRHVISSITDDIKLNLDLDDYLQRWMFCHYLKDETDYFWLSKFLREGDHFVDVGANIGIVSTIAAKKVGKNGCVYAVEALPQTREHLEKNIRLNQIDNIKIIPVALTDENKEVAFFASKDGNIGGSSLSEEGNKDTGIKVPGRTFDSLISEGEVKHCDVMKMDIEGAEMLALTGMRDLFDLSKPRGVMIEIATELLKQFNTDPEDILRFFSDHGYEWYITTPNGFKRFQMSELKSFNNLWAIQPGAMPSELLI